MHVFTLFGIPLYKFSKIPGESLDHASFMLFSSIFRLCGGTILSISVFIIAHKFSIGLRSSELPGQIPFSQNEDTLTIPETFSSDTPVHHLGGI